MESMSIDGSHLTGVPTPRPFTWTIRSSPSWTIKFNVSCMLHVSFISKVTASCKVSCGDKWIIFGCTVQSDFLSFMKARIEASIQELLVNFTCRVRGSRHLMGPQSSVGGSTSTRGPTEFAVKTRGKG